MSLILKQRRGKWYRSGTLLDLTNGPVSGSWQPVEGLFPVTINVDGDFSATVALYSSTSEFAPTDADANHGVLKTFTGPDVYILASPVEWLKVVVSGYASGGVTVTAEASEASSTNR